MPRNDSEADDSSVFFRSRGHFSFSDSSSSQMLDDFDSDSITTSDEESTEDSVTENSSSDEEEGSFSSSNESSEGIVSLSSSSYTDDSDDFGESTFSNSFFVFASDSENDTSSEDSSSNYLEVGEDVFSEENNLDQVEILNGLSGEISISLVSTMPLGRRKRRSSESGDLDNNKKICMDERKSEKAARELQIEETKEFLKGSHLECPICLDESPKIKNPMFCAFCFKLVGCEPCCRKWVQVSSRNTLRQNSTCPLCRHNFDGPLSSNLVMIYETEVDF